MASFVLTTDSNSELQPSWENEYDIQTIYMPYSLDDKEYIYDFGRTSDMAHFYARMREGSVPTTMQRNAEEFKEFWKLFLDAGKDVLYVGFSSALSGTFACAGLAAEELRPNYPERRIMLVDSLCIACPLGILVRRCAQMRQEGASVEAVHDWAQENKQRANAFFTVDSLTYLKRGGRVTGAAAFFGTMLDVKPMLHVDPQGRLVPVEKVKGRKKALRHMVQKIAEHMDKEFDGTIYVMHADCESEAQALMAQFEEAIQPKEILLQSIGPVIGAHVGPGAIAVGFFAKDRAYSIS